ncbi:MAG: ketopantoate reductase family protein [Candidatus Kariarchaeaceae archaeon]
MKIAVVGLGAIGTIVTAELARSGLEVHVVCKHPHILEAVKSKGVRVTGLGYDLTVKENIQPVIKEEELPQGIDILIIATRAWDVKPVLQNLLPKLDKNSTIIPLQNGIIEDVILEVVEASRVLSCVISYAAYVKDSVHADFTSSGEIVFGRLNGIKGELDRDIMSRFSLGGAAIWSENILGFKYSKLLMNSSITSLGLVSGMTVGELMSRRATRLSLLTIVTEGVKVALANDISLERVRKLNPEEFSLEKKEIRRFSLSYLKKHLILKYIGRKYKNYKSAALQSLEKGNPTEIDYLNGYIATKAEELGIQTPANQYITQLVHEIERGEKKSTEITLNELEAFVKNIWV